MLICWFIMVIRVIMSTSLTVFSILLMRNNRNVCLPQNLPVNFIHTLAQSDIVYARTFRVMCQMKSDEN